MEHTTYKEDGITYSQRSSFHTVIIEIEGGHNQIIINNAIIRKALGGLSNPFEVRVNNKWKIIKGRLAKGDNDKTFHIQGAENKFLIKEVLGL